MIPRSAENELKWYQFWRPQRNTEVVAKPVLLGDSGEDENRLGNSSDDPTQYLIDVKRSTLSHEETHLHPVAVTWRMGVG